MRAVVGNGPRDVAVQNVRDAEIGNSTEEPVRITGTNNCGSGLRMYEGRTDVPQGGVSGHENLGARRQSQQAAAA